MRRCLNDGIMCDLYQWRKELFEFTVFFIYFAWRACSSWSLLHAGLGAPRSSCQGVPRASIRRSKGNHFTLTINLLYTLLHNSSSRMYGATLES